MPQLNLWTQPTPTRIDWTYVIDPLEPEKDPRFIVVAKDHRGTVLDGGMAQVPLVCIHEAVADLLDQTWVAYLFGEPDDVRRVIGTRMRAWRREAAARLDA